MKRITLLILPLVAVAALAGCRKPPEQQTEAQRARAVTVVRIEPRSIVGSLTASGDLLPREEAAVLPEVNGYRVARVLADVGQYVKAGQTLVQLDPTLLEAQIAASQAQAAQAEDQARRVSGLDGQGVLSQEQIEQRRFQAKVATANLRNLQTQRRKLAVVAPVSGLILEKTVRPGDLAAGAGTPWFRMARDGQVELAADLAEADLARVRPGQSATVTLPGGGVANGRVRLVSPQIDPQTKLGEVRITLPVRPDIRAGGFARAVFDDASASVLAVPEAAIRYDANGASVMVVGADDRVKRVMVQTGARGGGLVQIVKGPPAGSRILANAGALFLDGDMVRPSDAPAAKPAVKR
ncbi:efflux RND transporter periplasmic adaptor subunit [Phenylobacterium sp.]|uniref:efflux RND transporter periplasmic adaptor subunit n=1 Tax=Phenylobacterium sp. TaxID=1871053 RepID=UPI0025CC69AA|nr:efflux RND transporter periplasmic adaptor subunit [Phenylobacterium sp.]MBX3481982.1 efflux RND transporter periplasmic adaptor subunit [Phenylobacterium sp.]MCW5758553.1 efflux RND transporter periplasmic adaptor subunit [Phenylobacterium sp.]